MKKRFVFNQSGFLLIEHLIAILLTSLLTMVAVVLLHVIKSYEVNTNQISHHEIETLTSRLQKEAKYAKFIGTNQRGLLLRLNNGTNVNYYVQNNRLTRQVNGAGGEIALYHCRSITVELINDQSARIEVISIFDDVFYIYISTFALPLEPLITDLSIGGFES